MGRIIGIDLGTTNSLACAFIDGKPVLIPNSLGEVLTPSVVSFEGYENVYVGEYAKERLVTHPDRTASVFKRYMGSDYRKEIGIIKYTPEVLSSLVLRKLKEDAEAYLGEEVTEAIISVPAYFNDVARHATKNAGLMAGLKVDRIINEPSAAALAYQNKSNLEMATVLVFDFGGGTLDVSLVDCFDNIVEIVAVSGDNHLGGTDFDKVIADCFISENKLNRLKLTAEEHAYILECANKIKEELSTKNATVMHAMIREKDYAMLIDNEKLIDLSVSIFKRINAPIQRVLTDSQIEIKDLSAVVLVGGSCKMPVVKKFIEHIFQGCPVDAVEPDYMIAYGTGVYAGIKSRDKDIKDMLLTDICPFSLGIAVKNHENPEEDLMSFIIERNTSLPCSISETYFPTVDYQKHIDILIYQGENMYVKDNLCLGSITTKLKEMKKEDNKVQVRFTYDINGILVVDIHADNDKEDDRLIIKNTKIDLSPDQINERVAELEKLKLSPFDDERNMILIERAKKYYSMTVGDLRKEIKHRLMYFNYLLKRNDIVRTEKFKNNFSAFLDMVSEYVLHENSEMVNVEEYKSFFSKSIKSISSEATEAELEYEQWEDEDGAIHFYKGE